MNMSSAIGENKDYTTYGTTRNTKRSEMLIKTENMINSRFVENVLYQIFTKIPILNYHSIHFKRTKLSAYLQPAVAPRNVANALMFSTLRGKGCLPTSFS